MLREMGQGMRSLAQEASSNEWISGSVKNILGSRKYKAFVTAGILSTAFDTSNAITDFKNGEFETAPSSAIHIAVELAAVEGLRRLIPGHTITLEPHPVSEPYLIQPQLSGNVIS